MYFQTFEGGLNTENSYILIILHPFLVHVPIVIHIHASFVSFTHVCLTLTVSMRLFVSLSL